jgi:hypothetical protein
VQLVDQFKLQINTDHDTEVTKTTLGKVLAKIKPWAEAPEDEASAQH